MRTSLTFRGGLLLRHSLLRRTRNRPLPRRRASFSRRHASCKAAIHINDTCDMTLRIPHDTANIHSTRAAQKPYAGTLPPQHLVCTVRLIHSHPRPSRVQPRLHRRKVHSLRGVSARPGPRIIGALQLEEALRLLARASTGTPSHTQLQALIPPRPQAISRINDAETPRRDAATEAPTPRAGRARRHSTTTSHARGPVAENPAQRSEDTGHAQRGTTDALPRTLRHPPGRITHTLARALPRPARRAANPNAGGEPPRANAPPPTLPREEPTQATVEPLGDSHIRGRRRSMRRSARFAPEPLSLLPHARTSHRARNTRAILDNSTLHRKQIQRNENGHCDHRNVTRGPRGVRHDGSARNGARARL